MNVQRSFITEVLADKLKLKPAGKETINISRFGENDRKVRHLHNADIFVITENQSMYLLCRKSPYLLKTIDGL